MHNAINHFAYQLDFYLHGFCANSIAKRYYQLAANAGFRLRQDIAQIARHWAVSSNDAPLKLNRKSTTWDNNGRISAATTSPMFYLTCIVISDKFGTEAF